MDDLPEIDDPEIERLRIGVDEKIFEDYPEIDDPEIERPRIGIDEKARKERQERARERARQRRERTRQRRGRIRNVVQSIYYGALYTFYETLYNLDYLLGDSARRDVSTTRVLGNYLMDKLQWLIQEEERIVQRKVEILDDEKPNLQPSQVEEEEMEIQQVAKEIDSVKLYEQQQTYRIIQENEEYRKVNENIQNLEVSIARVAEKPQTDEEIQQRKQLAQQKDEATRKLREIDTRRKNRERGELKEIQKIEDRVAQENERLQEHGVRRQDATLRQRYADGYNSLWNSGEYQPYLYKLS